MLSPEQASGGGGLLENLGINLKVLATQVVIFSITFLVLSKTLFGKALGFMKKREEEVQASHNAISRDRAEVAKFTGEYQAHLAQAEKAAYDKTQEILKEALAAAAATVAKAQADGKAQVQAALAEISREKQQASAQLRTEVSRLTKILAERVLETPVDEAAAAAAVQKTFGGRS